MGGGREREKKRGREGRRDRQTEIQRDFEAICINACLFGSGGGKERETN